MTHPERSPARDPWLWGAIALGAALRLAFLGAPSLWLDEALSARAATLPAAQILTLSAADVHPPGYYLALHLWTRPWPPARGGWPTEWALRSLSALASIAGLPVIYLLGLAWSASPSPRTARWSVALAALSPYSVGLAREARSYALLALLLAGLWWLWTKVRSGGGRAAWTAMALLLALSLWVHYIAGLFWFALTIAALAGRRRHPGFVKRWLLATAAAGVLWLPWAPRFLEHLASGGRTWMAFHHSPWLIARCAAGFFRGAASSDELGLWAVPILVVLAVGTRGGRVLLLLIALPLALAYGISFLTNVWDPRYFGGAATVAWVLAARGLDRLSAPGGARLPRVCALLLLLAMAVGLPQLRRSQEDWRGLVRALPAGPAVVVHPWVEPFVPFTYYAAGRNVVEVPGLRPGDGVPAPDPGLLDRLRDLDEAYLVVYLEDLYDPGRVTRATLAAAGLQDTGAVFTSGSLELRRFVRRPPATGGG